jgi:two-component system, NtrC family, sensor kinase
LNARSFVDLPIRRKLIAAILLTSSVALLIAGGAFIGFEWFSLRRGMQEDLQALARIIGGNSTAGLSFNDAAAVEETLSALKARSGIELACIYAYPYGYNGRLFAYYRRTEIRASCPDKAQAAEASFRGGRLHLFSDILLNDDRIGVLYLRHNLSALWGRLVLQLEVLAAVLLGALAAAYALAFFLQRFISQPVLKLAEVAGQISRSRDYRIRAPRQGADEIGYLTDRLNEMLKEIQDGQDTQRRLNESLERGIAERTRSNDELKHALEQLKDTQDQLIQTEKLASLGSMVAGVAHEINTPVGVSVTAASHLMDQAQLLRGEFSGGALKRSRLDNFLEISEQSTRIILSNLNRALELIQSFKQVAVDQSTSERREFNLCEYLRDVLLSLEPEIRKAGHRVDVRCEDGWTVNAVPGAISGILTNLVMNSIIHAYPQGKQGVIQIDVTKDNDAVRLRYQDDGQGISAEHLPRIFDPFFTTQPGKGGSGLGLHIVYNLVSQTLGGRIRAVSETNKGTAFLITFPIDTSGPK